MEFTIGTKWIRLCRFCENFLFVKWILQHYYFLRMHPFNTPQLFSHLIGLRYELVGKWVGFLNVRITTVSPIAFPTSITSGLMVTKEENRILG